MERWLNGLSYNCQDKYDMTQEIMWNLLGIQVSSFYIFWVCVCWQDFRKKSECIFINFSGYVWHDTRNNWLDCFALDSFILLNLVVAEVVLWKCFFFIYDYVCAEAKCVLYLLLLCKTFLDWSGTQRLVNSYKKCNHILHAWIFHVLQLVKLYVLA